MSRKPLILLFLLILTPLAWAKGVYMTAEQFLEKSFPQTAPQTQTLWLNSELKAQISKMLYRPYNQLRIRYWELGERRAWILDEIGKERPITIGLLVEKDQLLSVDILEFRESRGWEVKYPFFTRQFQGATLTRDHKLDQHIDGVTGATLSVAAVKRAAKLALFLSQQLTAD